ncbi:hypothetical protein RF11_09198 [Thelohanellus kitauei]|uniref:Kelch domain-containing protein 10 n=1 Tax=Thelohanellus kitauei TaxID=669202 RepID=A0A0C2NB83_THEKT|nr:hypothetical protein RF11_09198 [Thelohanellus kitauei]
MSGGKIFGTYTYFSDILKIDLETLKWFKLDYSLETCVCRHRMFVIDNSYLYCFGGVPKDRHNLHSLEIFMIRPVTLYHQCLKSICTSPNSRIYNQYLPASIRDELKINDTISLS